MFSKFTEPQINNWDDNNWQAEKNNICKKIKDWANQQQITIYHGIQYNNGTKTMLEDTTSEKIIYLQLFDMISPFQDWQNLSKKYALTGQKIFVITDNVIDFPVLDNVYFISVPEFLGTTSSYGTSWLDPAPQKKLYSCFIQRTDSIRQSWFYFLQHNNLLDQGHVSFLLKQLPSYSTLTGVDLFDFIHTNFKLGELTQFESAYWELRDSVPYRNFEEILDLCPYIMESKYSLILETYASYDGIGTWCWTEKSLRDLQLPITPLIFCQQGSFDRMKKLGFEIPNYDIDHLGWQQRQQALLSLLVNDALDESWTTKIERALHNRQLLSNWKQKYQSHAFFDVIFDQILDK